MYTSPILSAQATALVPQRIDQLPVSSVPSTLQRDDLADFIKKDILHYFMKQTVKNNEAQSIVTSVVATDLDTNAPIIEHNQDTPHFAASINKIPVTLLLLEDIRNHKLDMNQTITWQPSDRREGNGTYDQANVPTTAPLKDLMYDMLNRSGNTAVRVVVTDVLNGPAAVNKRLAAKPQLTHTRLQIVDENRFYLGTTTAKEALWSLNQLISSTDEATAYIKNALASNMYTAYGTRSQLAGNEFISLVNKVGIDDDASGNSRHDVGIMYNAKTKKTYAYAYLLTAPADGEAATAQATQSLQDMGRYLLRSLGDSQAQQLPQTKSKASGGPQSNPLISPRTPY
jgi:beta-lactamase class A